MVIQYVRYKIEKEDAEKFIAAHRKASEELDNSEVCLGHELTQCEEDPERFILRIEWSSVEDHMNGFRKSVQFRKVFEQIGFFLDAVEEMNHYHLTDIASRRAKGNDIPLSGV
ncbi:antibiotic biosynthesis monooxygenase family protein [Sinomicrobium weinanense]|uniref:Antibiotic biosynthesis monooxygenase n=1 Tax=Sinomicrobium weinanense TaxID=2842200 RepID=A0A926Q2U3_9FLAO|nr:antibiotic biosynthesis monooxygenase family protein [Sinomicrobium weinanense]MBC9796179.1 antibiotic biosynthesis monooxygenase [Sinomicrobium weinanense]MBU3123458.1 antibiotic biosynthesis monooxygenase [Sinomicrobium weinanense]